MGNTLHSSLPRLQEIARGCWVIPQIGANRDRLTPERGKGWGASSWCAEVATKVQWYLDSATASKAVTLVGSQLFICTVLQGLQWQGEKEQKESELHSTLKKGARFETGAEPLGWYVSFWSTAWNQLAFVPRSHTAAPGDTEIPGGQALSALPQGSKESGIAPLLSPRT